MEPSSSKAVENPFKYPPGQSNDREKVILRLYTDPTHKANYTVLKLGDRRIIDFSRSTKILIHDLNAHHLANFPQVMKDAYLENNFNVILVDWAELAGQNMPTSVPATVHLRLYNVAFSVTEILRNLVTTSQLDLSNVHLVGNSVGCHLGAIIAKSLKAEGTVFGRITALDPLKNDVAAILPDVLFQDDDATFIDAYHIQALSKCQQVGHVDFFIREICPGSHRSSGFEDACNIFLETILKAPDSYNVTSLVTRYSPDEPACTDSKDEYDEQIILGEHCFPTTKGNYGIDYDWSKKAFVGGFEEKST